VDVIVAAPPGRSPPAPPASSGAGASPAAAAFPELAPQPAPSEASRWSHDLFRILNPWTAVPLLRAGLGAWLGTPIGGYLLLLRVRGRRSGLIREIPLSYFVAEGAPWVLAGYGPVTQWYRNLLADPRVEVVLPGRTIVCDAEDVRDPDVRRRILPALVRAVGLPAYLGGVDPRDPDERIVEQYAWVPLIKLRPVGGPIAAGPDDPGGTAWLWRQSLILAVTIGVAWMAIAIAGSVLGRRRP
jgi:deazaflavin-dependent oxidoreductase (nitroreductase family)